MAQTTLTFCENGECEVILYESKTKQQNTVTNCPACGRYGRLKDRPTAQTHEPNDDPV